MQYASTAGTKVHQGNKKKARKSVAKHMRRNCMFVSIYYLCEFKNSFSPQASLGNLSSPAGLVNLLTEAVHFSPAEYRMLKVLRSDKITSHSSLKKIINGIPF